MTAIRYRPRRRASLLLIVSLLSTSEGFSSSFLITRTRTPTVQSFFWKQRQHGRQPRLTTTANGHDPFPKQSALQRAVYKFKARPGTYLLIPCVAAIVGLLTNYLAVQMIFYPIHFRGIPIYQRPGVPLGLLGWQGIIPCKTRKMTEAMVNMVTTQLLSVKDAFARLDPNQVANLLAPEVPKLTQEIWQDLVPSWITSLPGALYSGLDSVSQGIVRHFNHQFLENLTKSLQTNVDQVFNLKSCVIDQMMQDRSKLGELFKRCGQKELDFLTNSGLWFGFLLGCIQMVVALFFENPWSLSIGGGVVGFATNWLALKWIFAPVNPLKIGPFTIQGMFLQRQKEVAAEFSSYFARNILTAQKIWHSVLTDPTTQPAFAALFAGQFQKFVGRITRGFGVALEPVTLEFVTNKAVTKLPQHVGVTYDYMDKTLGLEDTLRVKMEQMTSHQFERVLHPIFEEDELTLILAGAVLGFAAGLVQQGLETGSIRIPNFGKPIRQWFKAPRRHTRILVRRWLVRLRRFRLTRMENFRPNGEDIATSSSSSSTANPRQKQNTEEQTDEVIDEDNSSDNTKPTR